jgi:hypothetical protein
MFDGIKAPLLVLMMTPECVVGKVWAAIKG